VSVRDEPKPPSSWTPEIVRDHVLSVIEANDKRYEDKFTGQDKAVNAALAAQEKAVNAALAASEKAVLVAENNAEKWRANANEWRAAMSDRETRFANRGDLEAIKERLDRMEGADKGVQRVVDTRRAANSNLIALASVIAGVVGAIVGAAFTFLKG
jgi:hypothetical protein